MINLARNFGQGYILLKDIAKWENIPEKYLSLIVIPLKSAGLLNSVRGPRGGYMLSKPPGDINIKDIMSSLEGELNFFKSRDTNFRESERWSELIINALWADLNKKIIKYFNSTSLEDLIKKYDKNNKRIPIIYDI